jgi:hypothetical protein
MPRAGGKTHPIAPHNYDCWLKPASGFQAFSFWAAVGPVGLRWNASLGAYTINNFDGPLDPHGLFCPADPSRTFETNFNYRNWKGGSKVSYSFRGGSVRADLTKDENDYNYGGPDSLSDTPVPYVSDRFSGDVARAQGASPHDGDYYNVAQSDGSVQLIYDENFYIPPCGWNRQAVWNFFDEEF